MQPRDSSDGRATDCRCKKEFRWPGVRITLARFIFYLYIAGDVAQMVECLLSMRKVVGSMPTVSINGRVSSGYDISFTPKRSPVQSRP